MALADTITSLGNSIISLVGTRAKKDLSDITTAGEGVIKTVAGTTLLDKDLAQITTTGENKIKTIAGGSLSAMPVGTVIAFMGAAEPDGYILMDGREISKTTYANLYAVVGDSMGTAKDSSKFVIADMTDGRYLMGSTVAGSSVAQAIPSHNHVENFAWYDNSTNTLGTRHWAAAVSGNSGASKYFKISADGVIVSSNTTSYVATGNYGSGSKVLPLSRKCKFIIRY